MDGLIRLATLLVVLSVEAQPLNLRGTTLEWKGADAAQASVSNLCFVETGRGKAKQRTPYILDFGGECPAADSAAYYKKNLRYNMSK